MSNTNTFNTFWKGVERNGGQKDKINYNKLTEKEQNLNKNDENGDYDNKSRRIP